MIVRHNDVHDNYGSGLWWDTNSRNAKVYGNRIYDNRNCGILYETSLGGTKIHHNTLINNAIGDGTVDWTLNVQLSIASLGRGPWRPRGIEIYANTIGGDAYPLLGLVISCRAPFDQAGAGPRQRADTACRLIASWGCRRFGDGRDVQPVGGQQVPGQHLPSPRPARGLLGVERGDAHVGSVASPWSRRQRRRGAGGDRP